MSTQTITAAGETFHPTAFDSEFFACEGCGGLVSGPETDFGIDPEDHVCHVR